jgi:hypothetical protein
VNSGQATVLKFTAVKSSYSRPPELQRARRGQDAIELCVKIRQGTDILAKYCGASMPDVYLEAGTMVWLTRILPETANGLIMG